jgi:hypothetical protein
MTDGALTALQAALCWCEGLSKMASDDLATLRENLNRVRDCAAHMVAPTDDLAPEHDAFLAEGGTDNAIVFAALATAVEVYAVRRAQADARAEREADKD